MSVDRPRSSLNNKVMRLLGVVIAILLLGNGLIFSFVIWPTFSELERREGEQNAQRVAEVLLKEQDDLGRSTRDFSAWDETYGYVVEPNEDYDHQTFTVDVMRDLGMQLIAIYDTNGHRVQGATFDLDSGNPITIDPFMGDMPTDHPLLARDRLTGVTGILLTAHGPMLLASFPILQSTREGPIRGTFFMGRMLNQALVDAMAEQTHVKFDVFLSRCRQPGNLRNRMPCRRSLRAPTIPSMRPMTTCSRSINRQDHAGWRAAADQGEDGALDQRDRQDHPAAGGGLHLHHRDAGDGASSGSC